MELVVAILMPVTFAAMLAVEVVVPGRPLPHVRGWYAKGIACFVVVAGAYVIALPRLADGAGTFAPIHAPAVAGLAAFALADAVSQMIHRAVHRNERWWRWTHQLHHSAERVDVAGAAFLHPFDLGLHFTALAIVVAALGLSPAGAALAGYLTVAAQLFSHVNVRTPQWLGWIIQRPEAHAVHHTRGVHAYNYGTLTVWDIALGTFRNPARFSSEPSGFGDVASTRVLDMLVGRNVGEPAHTSEGDTR